jgi:hypothetical protein
MSGELIINKKGRRALILLILIFLDIFAYGFFDTYTMIRLDPTKIQELGFDHLNRMAGRVSWLFSMDNLLNIPTYGIVDIVNTLHDSYTENSLILGKAVILGLSAIILIAIFRFAPDLLPVCYGYLSGIAIVGFYDGLLNLGFNGIVSGILPVGLDPGIIPKSIMALCIVTGGAIAFSTVVSYLFAEAVTMRRMQKREALSAGHMAVKDVVRINNMDLPEYEEKIKALARTRYGNDIGEISSMSDKVNELARSYNVDQYYILYDVYKIKNGKKI